MERERIPSEYDIFTRKTAQKLLDSVWELVDVEDERYKKTTNNFERNDGKAKKFVGAIIDKLNIPEPQIKLQYRVELVDALKNGDKTIQDEPETQEQEAEQPDHTNDEFGGMTPAPAITEEEDNDPWLGLGSRK